MTKISFPALASSRRLPNMFDLAAILCVAGALFALANGARETLAPLSAPEAVTIHLDPSYLPEYAVRTTLRMFAALFCSLIFTFTFATAAAKSRRAERVMIPLLDILQSVPILGFLSFTVVFFMSLFPGRVLGAELAAIFAIFTSQAWNMAFSFYQSLTTVPADLSEAARSFRLTGWQKFWRLEVPFALPGLVWNTMMSMSGGWFFVVASEAVAVGDTTWKLPGIGSYVAAALEERNVGAVFWAILAMGVVILAYDQLLFRPLTAWSAKFRVELTAGAEAEDPWVLALLRRTRVLRGAMEKLGVVIGLFTGMRLSFRSPRAAAKASAPSPVVDVIWLGVLGLVVAAAVWKIVSFVSATLTWSDLGEATLLGCFTLLRVAIMMTLASLVWVPVGVWLGLRPNWSRRVQPIVQFLAAFPANLFFPPVVIGIVYFHLTPDIWLTPLMVLGTQWYILFNVIAGAAAFPGDLQEASKNFQIKGFLWWRRVILPGIFPYFVTGAITASGGSWNAAIVSEVAAWGNTKLAAHGLGAYIAQATDAGDTAKIVLGVVVMSVFVVGFNRVLWRPLFAFGTRRMSIS
jgi:NitT/TauT family transport system permease protein